MSLAQFAIDLILAVSFVASACAIFLATRAVVKGEVISTSRFLPKRKILSSVNPIQFWTEIAFYHVAAVFLLLLGLMFFNIAPNWFYELMLHKSKPG
jgi:hypothetical protein